MRTCLFACVALLVLSACTQETKLVNAHGVTVNCKFKGLGFLTRQSEEEYNKECADKYKAMGYKEVPK